MNQKATDIVAVSIENGAMYCLKCAGNKDVSGMPVFRLEVGQDDTNVECCDICFCTLADE